MGRGQRVKGAVYEREVAEQLRTVYPAAKRGLRQVRCASEDADVEGTPWWVEAKRGDSTSPRAAWKQAHAATDGRPVLVVYRDDHADSVVMLRLDQFIALVRDSQTAKAPVVAPADPYPDGRL